MRPRPPRFSILIVLAGIVPACQALGPDKAGPPGASADSGGADGTGTDLPCHELSGHIGAVTLTPTAVPTVFEVAVDTELAATVTLVVTDAEGSERRAAATSLDGMDHTGLLLGLPPSTPLELRVEAELDGAGTGCTLAQAFSTGAYPSGLPLAVPSLLEPERTPGYHLVSVLGEDTVSVAIYDESGVPVWGHLDWDRNADDVPGEPPIPEGAFPPFIFRVRLDPQGRGVVFNKQADGSADRGALVTMSWTGEVLEEVFFDTGHTDFVLLPDGSSAMLGWVVQDMEGRRILGDSILVRSPDGEVTQVWSSFDQFVPDLSRTYPTGFTADDPPLEDWSHVNSLAYDPVDDAFLVTETEPPAVVKVDRATGAAHWVLMTGSPDFDGVARDLVEFPHSVQQLDDGVLVFNRSQLDRSETCSRFTDVVLDPDAGRVVSHADWMGAVCRQNGFLGGAERLASGSTVVTWSSYGLIEEVAPDGTVLASLGMPIGAGFGFGVFEPTLPGALQ